MQHQIKELIQLLRGNIKPVHSYELKDERIQFISTQLQTFVNEERPFLRSGYNIHDLASDIKVPSYQLSAYLNRELGLNFNDYMNQFRVRHCEDLIQKGLVNTLNLRGIALCCGFTNRNTLTTAFKKFTGDTPSHYQKRQVTAA